MDFKEIFLNLREEKNLNKSAMAKILKVANKTIKLWEDGTKLPSFENIKKISEYFKISADILLGLNETERPITISQAEEFTAEEKKLIKMYRSLDETHRHYIYDNVRLYYEAESFHSVAKKKA